MRKVALLFILFANSAFCQTADKTKASHTFTQDGLKGKPILRSCYRDPCSVARVMSYQVLESHATNQLLKLNLVGGSKNWDSKKIKWNHKAHDVYIRCSLTKPTVQSGEQKTLIPLNPNGVYGAVMSDTELYLKACHNYKGSDAEAAKKFGYDVRTLPSTNPIKTNTPKAAPNVRNIRIEKQKYGIKVTNCTFDFDGENFCTDNRLKKYAQVLKSRKANFDRDKILFIFDSNDKVMTRFQKVLRAVVIEKKTGIVSSFGYALLPTDKAVNNKGEPMEFIFNTPSNKFCFKGRIEAYKNSNNYDPKYSPEFCFIYNDKTKRLEWE